MASSYERVFRLLNETEEAKRIRETVKRAYENARVTGWEFRLEGTGTELDVKFRTSFHERSSFYFSGSGTAYPDLDSEFFVSKPELKEIVHRHFDHDVPTFFCRKKVVLEGCNVDDAKKERGRAATPSFVDWFKTALQEEFTSLREEKVELIRTQVTEIFRSQEFAEEKRQALKACAKAELVKLMRRFSPLGNEFMREAVSEFVVADVLES